MHKQKKLTLSDVSDIKISPNTNDYLIGEIEVQGKDFLTMFINKENLEFEEFYSSLQNKMILVIPNTKEETYSFESRFYMTIQREVIDYIKQETLKQKERIKDVQRLMIKK